MTSQEPGHELLYFVHASLAGDDPRALFSALPEHLAFLADLDAHGNLVFAGPLETPDGANSGTGIYALRASSLAEAEQIVARDPMHAAGIRSPKIYRWNRRTDWSPDSLAIAP